MNPFTYGNPISDPARFVGRAREVDQIVARLRNREFESTSIVGDRRVGKTSLLLHLSHPQVGERHGLADGSYAFVYEDLQLVDRSVTPTRPWQRLLRKMARQCGDPQVSSTLVEACRVEPIDTFLLDEVFDALGGRRQRVVLLLDEFEHITQNENFGVDFFYGLRSLAIHHGLALVTSSRRELVELCHSDTIRSSPFFNIFAQVPVRLLGRDEALFFFTTSLSGTNVVFRPEETALALSVAGTHPFFLQAACHFLFDAYASAEAPWGRAARACAPAFRSHSDSIHARAAGFCVSSGASARSVPGRRPLTQGRECLPLLAGQTWDGLAQPAPVRLRR